MRNPLVLLASACMLVLAACADTPVQVSTSVVGAGVSNSTSPLGCWSYYAHTTVRRDFNLDLNDFAYILRDSQDPNCYAEAKTRLQAKMGAIPLDYWTRWLSGGSLSMALAAGMNIGYFTDIGPTLDVRLRNAANSYQRTLQTETGYPGGAVVCGVGGGNTCLEDYAMGNTTYSWIAAYRRWTGRDWRPARTLAINDMKSTLAASTSCIRYNGARANDPVKNFCNGTLAELRAGTASILSMNHGYQTPAYGVGQMTSLAAGFVALEIAEAPVQSSEIPLEQRDIAKALFMEGAVNASSAGDWNAPNCYQASGTSLISGVPCYDPPAFHPAEDWAVEGNMTHYRADMFPVYRFYQKYGLLPTLSTGQYNFSSFRDVFRDTDSLAFFGVARKDFYGTMANTWLDSRPPMGARPVRAGGLRRGSYYLSAATGSALQAVYTSRQVHGTFTIVKLSGTGPLRYFDAVAVQNYQGYYLTTCNSTGVVTATATTVGMCEKFNIIKTNDGGAGPIAHGDSFGLRAQSNSRYLRIPPGGNADVTATSIQSYETIVVERTNTEAADGCGC
ncbi:MAG TPA: hypothetical protein VHG93_20980 [Longimicrobium sp.]|nr:hypothetical protein [Longimicrobium sp.]